MMYKLLYKSVKEIISDKFYLSCLIIIIIILSYGFMLTNYSIGPDDLSLDLYVDNTYILSAGRFGTWLIYNIFRINTFTPFWLEFVSILLLAFNAIILSASFKIITKSRLKKASCIIFSCGFLSFPILFNYLIYQPTNLTVSLSNLLVSVFSFYLYYSFFISKNNKLKWYLIPLFTFTISMYEACCQTFLLLIFILAFLHCMYNKYEWKEVTKFVLKSILILFISIFLYYLIINVLFLILKHFDLLKRSYAAKRIIFNTKYFKQFINLKIFSLFYLPIIDNNYLYIYEFIFSNIIFIVFVLIKNKCISFISLLSIIIIIINYILFIINIPNLYRTYFSWSICLGFILLYFYQIYNKYKIVVVLLILYVILMNSKNMNQLFYCDYKVYKEDVAYANYVASEINNISIDKPILFVRNTNMDKFYVRNDYFDWGYYSFGLDNSPEIQKFFKQLGYNLKYVKNYDLYYNKYKRSKYYMSNKKVIEFDDFIVVNVNYKLEEEWKIYLL